MSNVHSTYEHKEHDEKLLVSERIDAIIEKEYEAMRRSDLSDPEREEWEETIRRYRDCFLSALDPAAAPFVSMVSDDLFREIVRTVFFREYKKKTGLFKSRSMPIATDALSLEMMKNVANHCLVSGYDNPDLAARGRERPVPSASELLLGCYAEQIEAQTRNAVLILRQKGYETVESGFFDRFIGSQFFHFEEVRESEIPTDLIEDLRAFFDVSLVVHRDEERRSTEIELVATSYKDLRAWQVCLDFFAERMPVKGLESFASTESGVDFALDMMGRFSLEEILKTARSEHEASLIRTLYGCKTEEDVRDLITPGWRENDSL